MILQLFQQFSLKRINTWMDAFVSARKIYYESQHIKHRGITRKEKVGSLLTYLNTVAFILAYFYYYLELYSF